MTDHQKAAGAGKPQAASKFSTSHSTNNRFAMLAGRILAILEHSGIRNDDLITIRISTTDKDGKLIKYGIVDDLHGGPHE